jgi:uncharacterized cupredoxin-like copper-binding protein
MRPIDEASEARPVQVEECMSKYVRALVPAVVVAVLVAVPVAQAKSARSAATITVTEGKPTEFTIKLSVKKVAHGTVTFKVTNGGNVPHDFKVCSAPTTKAPVDTCAGKGTKQINMGTSSTLTVKFLKAGKYEYLCSVPGHSTAGMKGLLTVT